MNDEWGMRSWGLNASGSFSYSLLGIWTEVKILYKYILSSNLHKVPFI